MTHNKPTLPVVEVDQAFPLLTTEGATRGGMQSTTATDQAPAVTAAIRDVLGWRPRRQDTAAFTAALDASFQLQTVEGHIEARYVPRGYAVQADLGGVTGGQASLYTRAQAAHTQITRMLDALKPLRPDHDPEDCEAYRSLVRDSVRRIVSELGTPGGPRVELVDSAFAILTGQQFGGTPGYSLGAAPPAVGRALMVPQRGGLAPVPLAPPGTTADDIPGQLGALRDRFGLTDDNVNTVDEEKIRTAFLTLVDLIVDLQRSWQQQRVAFASDVGRGFLGTELVLINRLMAAAAEQVDEVEAVLESALVSSAERQTIVLNNRTRITLDGLLGWMRVFLTEDGPRIVRDTGRDGLTTTFTPTVLTLLQALRTTLIGRLVPCGSATCGGLGGCRCSHRGAVSYLPVGCCPPLPPGMYAGRTKIAVSGLCGLLERLARAAARIGRFSGAVLLDVVVTPFDDIGGQSPAAISSSFVRVEVRGLHLRPSYLPAFVDDGASGLRLDELVLPVQGSGSADTDSVVGIFDVQTLPEPLRSTPLGDGAVFAAGEIPLALVDGETGRVVSAPPVTTWPDLRPASAPSDTGGPFDWNLPQDQRWVPQGTDPAPSQEAEDECIDDVACREECPRECGEDCGPECDCGCHLGSRLAAALEGAGRYLGNQKVRAAFAELWTALDDAKLLGTAGGAVRDYAKQVQASGPGLQETFKRVIEALREADRPAARPRRAAAAAQPAPRFATETTEELAAVSHAAREQAAAELEVAEREARRASDIAQQHADEAKAAEEAATDTAEWATTTRERADQSTRAARQAVQAREVAKQRLEEAERRLRVASLAVQAAPAATAAATAPDEAALPARPIVRLAAAAADAGGGIVTVHMPELGESITEGTITVCLKREGERVEAEEPLFHGFTDQATIEIQAPMAGVVRSIKVPVFEAVRVGAELVEIETAAAGQPVTEEAQPEEQPTEPEAEPADAAAEQPSPRRGKPSSGQKKDTRRASRRRGQGTSNN